MFSLLPDTPEMNPREQIWTELREKEFRSEVFLSPDKAAGCPCETICSLTREKLR